MNDHKVGGGTTLSLAAIDQIRRHAMIISEQAYGTDPEDVLHVASSLKTIWLAAEKILDYMPMEGKS